MSPLVLPSLAGFLFAREVVGEAWEAARRRYSNPGKNKSRMVPVRIAERLPTQARYLELSGGGLSAEAVLAVRPDLEVVSAEIDEALWPDLRDHAADLGYEPIFGSFTQASGRFDLIYLDLTGNSSETSMELVRSAATMVASDGWLLVTITPSHELDNAVSLNRPVTVVSLLAAETGMRPVGAMRYPSNGGQRVTLTALRGRPNGGSWSHMLNIYKLDEDMKRRDFWINGRNDSSGIGFIFGDRNTRYRADPKNAEVLAAGSKRTVDKRRIRLLLDPEYAERQREWRKAYRQRPDVKASHKARHAEWQRSPEGKAWAKAYRERRKTAVSGTAAEAVSFEEAA